MTAHLTEGSPGEAVPVVLVYDRHATKTRAILHLRLEIASSYARERHWEEGGVFVDQGEDALSNDHRPAFEQMLTALDVARRGGREVVCLVNNWDRFSRDEGTLNVLARRVVMAGGWVETCFGETHPHDSFLHPGRLTSAPLVG